MLLALTCIGVALCGAPVCLVFSIDLRRSVTCVAPCLVVWCDVASEQTGEKKKVDKAILYSNVMPCYVIHSTNSGIQRSV